VIRQKGQHPGAYQDVWQLAMLIDQILKARGLVRPEEVNDIGRRLMTCCHWIRGLDIDIAEQTLMKIGLAMCHTKDTSAGIKMSRPRVRVAKS
jgi:hypothetical protein